jgi:hypothetical protein
MIILRMDGRQILSLYILTGALILASGLRNNAQSQQFPPISQSDHSSPKQDMPGMDMGDMSNMGHANGTNSASGSLSQRAESDAVHSMQPGHHMDGAHMRMTAPRPATPEDWARADQIVSSLRISIEKYKDYRVALAEGYRIFMPKLPQPMYHFTNYWNGFLEGFTFDATRPTSLLYKKTKDGYELIGAMYTATKNASLEELNDRVPLGVARWHAHTNLCMPKTQQGVSVDWTRFGLNGSISTPQACQEAGGRFFPQIFGWMVHVYPFEASRDKIWAQ